MSRWFENIEQNEYTRRMADLGEQLNAMDFQPGLDAMQAELAYYSGLDVPTANPYLRFLLGKKVGQLRAAIASKEHDLSARGAKAIEGCAEDARANWAQTMGLGGTPNISGGDWAINRPTQVDRSPAGVGMTGPLGTWGDWPGANTGGVYSSPDKFRISGRVNDVSRWNIPDKYTATASEAPGGYMGSDYIPSAWIGRYIAGDTLRPMSAQESPGGMKLATLQEMQGVLQEGGLGKINSIESYMNVAQNFPTHWEDYLQTSLENIPKYRGAQTKWYSPIQK